MIGKDMATPTSGVVTKEAFILGPWPCGGPLPAILKCSDSAQRDRRMQEEESTWEVLHTCMLVFGG